MNENTPVLDVPGLIRRVRRTADLSQRDLAARAEVSQSALARWEIGESLPDLVTFQRLLSIAGYTLRLEDADGERVQPMTSSAPLDRQRRQFPAHLDVIDDQDPYTGTEWLRTPRREMRDVLRRIKGVPAPSDHPTRAQLEAARALRIERIRARAAARMATARARRERAG